MTKGDKVLIYSVLILAFIFFTVVYFQKSSISTGIAIIRSRGNIIAEVDLDMIEKETIHIEGSLGISQARVEDGFIQMLSSPCKDQICVKQGKIQNSGQSIVCVPNEVSISIEKKGEVDEITR